MNPFLSLRSRVVHGMALALLLPLVACEAAESVGSGAEATRETRPDGGTLVRYGPLPEEADHVLEPELQIGLLEGPDAEVFGDVRSVDAGPDGAIYVLDAQAREIRVFEADGTFRTVLARGGEGPGEIQMANGLQMDEEGRLWVNDHGKFSFMALDAETGEEVALEDFPVRSFGAIWHGTRDREGRFWTRRSQLSSPTPPSMESGPVETEARSFMISIDPTTGQPDSIDLGTVTGTSYQFAEDGRYSVQSVPFSPTSSVVVDPEGGFWRTPGAPYTVVRFDGVGDTILVLESSEPRVPVTEEERSRSLAGQSGREEWMVEAYTAAMELAPDHHASIGHLVLDDEGRLWVERTMERGDPRRYDLFDREGHHLATLDFGFEAYGWAQPRIRNGQLYIQAPGEMEVPTVVRVPLPEL